MSDFWVRKMKTYFQRIDFDKDGAITQKDFEGMADRFVAREKLDDERGKELKTKLLQASALNNRETASSPWTMTFSWPAPIHAHFSRQAILPLKIGR